MCEELQVNIGTRTAWSARFAPSALRRAALRVSLPLILALLAGLGLIVSVPACAAEPSLETPVPENIPDAPPPGNHVLPGLTLSGYVTAQFLVPDARSGSQPALNSAVADDEPQSGRRPRLNLSHLSGIAWWEPSPAWKVLGEIDLQDVVQVPAHLVKMVALLSHTSRWIACTSTIARPTRSMSEPASSSRRSDIGTRSTRTRKCGRFCVR